MVHEDFTVRHRQFSRIVSWSGFAVGIVYTIFAALAIASDPPTTNGVSSPFSNPFNPIASFVLLPTAALLIACMAAVYTYTPRDRKVYGLLSLAFMTLAMGITSVINFSFFLVLTHPAQTAGTTLLAVVYPPAQPRLLGQVDYMAWSWLFGLSMLTAAPIFFGGDKREKTLGITMLATGALPVIGWLTMLFIPSSRLPAMLIQSLGWGVLILVVVFLLARLFDRTKPVEERSA